MGWHPREGFYIKEQNRGPIAQLTDNFNNKLGSVVQAISFVAKNQIKEKDNELDR